MLSSLDPLQVVFLAILVGAFVLLVTEKLRTDVVAILIILSLAVTGVLTPAQALSGFGSEPAIVVASVFVMAGALHQTGVSSAAGRFVRRLAGATEVRSLLVLMPTVAVLSAFTHHVTMTAVMLPVLLEHARATGIAPSKLLMPVAIAASLGTTITIIGAPAFLIADGVLEGVGRPGLGVFSIAPIGLALSAVGTGFVVAVGRWLIPARAAAAGDSVARFRLDEYHTELRVLTGSPWIGKTIAAIEANKRYRVTVVGWLRGKVYVAMTNPNDTLQSDDVLLVRTSPEEIVTIQQALRLELNAVSQYARGGSRPVQDVEDLLVQVVIGPRSDLVGRTIGEINFHWRYGAIVVSLWRKESWLREEIAKTPLREGDVLVLLGDAKSLDRVAVDPAFLLMVPFHGESTPRHRSTVAVVCMVGAVLLAALEILPIHLASLCGAVAVVLYGCMTVRQAYKAIDTRIFVFIAGAIPLGLGMRETKTDVLIAGVLQEQVANWPPFFILLALFGVVAALTQCMSDAATTAIFAPVAAALALALGVAPEPFVVTVAMASVAAFLTPIGHHGNLLVYAPGGYRFADFVRVGTPLTILLGVVVAWMAPRVWPG